ncbi:HEPN domain-containing protein [Pseudanabaena sp. BC1403]|uniref:HEPN domain-containing protein n=1 Tax=Pseudanabaena sp. BC1403 TaxID=2043171 RepID=UPI000CD84243|nr:HEPN domain-containing protein [Pseudanabaena sp. BC1403]
MPKSIRFRVLERELLRLKKQFLPRISPTGLYSDRKIALTIAYIVLAHAEIEAYFEDRVWETALHAKRQWDSQRVASRTLICLVTFSGQKMELPPDTLTPVQGSRTIPDDRIKIDKKIEIAVNAFRGVIHQNHGLKEANLLALLLPIGIDSNDLDPAMLATMNTFGQQRGLVAHSSATSYRATQIPDPANELSKIQQITQEILRLDSLISNLM